MFLRPLDKDALRKQYLAAEPFPFVKIDDLLDPAFADEVSASYPTFEKAGELGFSFKSVNERRKIQITDEQLFPEPAKRLKQALSSPEFLSTLSEISGVPKLLADDQLLGGGLHLTGPGGRLDVHVDFNLIEERKLYRRLNLLLYLNPTWKAEWGGHIQLWDRAVKDCRHDFEPKHNRCVIFETSDHSYHGVTPVAETAEFDRRSFAAYYYTEEAPALHAGTSHSTIFHARPDERVRGLLLMPAEKLQTSIRRGIGWAKREVKRAFRGG
jgi:Rps23 Pro-64 3,4-dihydroxylase Tpa1-like proline 4-hydroxylase